MPTSSARAASTESLGEEVKLLDGVMMAIRSQNLIARDLRFDARFHFHFYDLDFCCQAEIKGIRMGTWPSTSAGAGL
jgi:GT2 family glycosyltransferase